MRQVVLALETLLLGCCALKASRAPCPRAERSQQSRASDLGCCRLLFRSSRCQASARCCQAWVSSLMGRGGSIPQELLCPAASKASLQREDEAKAQNGSSTWLSDLKSLHLLA